MSESTVNIESTTDTPEQVQSAIGGAPETKEKVDPAAAGDKPAAETTAASGAEEKQETKTAEAKATGDEEEEIETAGQTKEPPAKRNNGVEKRIGELTKARRAAESERDYLRAELERARASKEAKPDPKTEVSVDAAPKAGDFAEHEDYIRALTKYEVAQTTKAKEVDDTKKASKAEFDSKIKSFNTGFNAVAKANPDAFEVIDAVDDCPQSAAVEYLFLNHDRGPELAYQLAKQPEEWKRINALAPMAAARELGKFEAAHLKAPAAAAKTETKETKLTKAPDPINPVKAQGGAGSEKNPDDMSQVEFNAWREKSRRKRR